MDEWFSGGWVWFIAGASAGIAVGYMLRAAVQPRSPSSNAVPGKHRRATRRKDHVYEHVCSECNRPFVYRWEELRPLAGAEMALLTVERQRVDGHALAECRCPYCSATHSFVVDGVEPRWLGANLYVSSRYVGPDEKYGKNW